MEQVGATAHSEYSELAATLNPNTELPSTRDVVVVTQQSGGRGQVKFQSVHAGCNRQPAWT
ncbi:hypothetical protein ACH5RR_024003, partial [Cinchona calisaya]